MNSDTVDVNIYPFDFNSVPSHPIIVFIAKRRGGKSTWMSEVGKQLPCMRKGIVMAMAGSEETKDDWKKAGVHPLFIHDPSIQTLEKLRDTQNRRYLEAKAQGKEEMDEKYHVKLFIDDVGCFKKIMQSLVMDYIASNGRHLCLTLLVSLQYFNQLSSAFRAQVDLLVALGSSHRRNITKLYDEFASFAELRLFKSVLAGVTESYGALIIDNTKTGCTVLSDNCFFSKIEHYPIPPQVYGSAALNKYAKKHYIDRQRASLLKNKILANDIEDDQEDDDDSVFDDTDLAVLDNKRIFTDRRGRIVIRKCLGKPKQKTE